MQPRRPLANTDAHVNLNYMPVQQLYGDAVLLGNWFVFIKPTWTERLGIDQLLVLSGRAQGEMKPAILFRGRDKITLPGVEIAPTPFPAPVLASITCDKQLYRANRDTIRLLIAASLKPNAPLRLALSLSGNPYATYPLTLDAYGLCLWSMRDLPEGEYVAKLEGLDAEACRFEVAEYRLAALNAELTEQQLTGETLSYTLTVTAFGQPYSGVVEVELQERGQRVGGRTRLSCDPDGSCRGSVTLAGSGPYTLSVFAGERTATVALKGSEQPRREVITINELGTLHQLSLLPLPQAQECRGMYVSASGANTEPIAVSRVIGNELQIEVRSDMDLLRIVMVDPVRNHYSGHYYEHVRAGQKTTVPVPSPYGVLLLGALMDGKAWEGWCAALRPSELQMQCEAPAKAKPGSRISVTLKTGVADRVVPVQLIVKDQRLIAPSDPQVEFAACIKKNLAQWEQQTSTGEIERTLSSITPLHPQRMYARASMQPMVAGGMAVPPPPQLPPAPPPGSAPTLPLPRVGSAREAMSSASLRESITGAFQAMRAPTITQSGVTSVTQATQVSASSAAVTLTPVRLQFPEVVYNELLHVQGEAQVEVKLGESMAQYSIEAFALSPETLDWTRVATTVNAVQPVYGELTVSPFVFAGDVVMGRLDVGAASGSAFVEVRHDGELLPLSSDTGAALAPDEPIPSGSVVRFPVAPGTITAVVRDAATGETDVSERYISEPGKLRHIARRLRLLTPGEEVTLQDLHALELQPLPGLERPFQVFTESAAMYPFGCIEQTSCKLLAMYTGYIANSGNGDSGGQGQRARDYEAAIPVWYRRLKSMYLPQRGFCFYPPEERGGSQTPDTHYGPLGVEHLFNLRTAERAGLKNGALREMLEDIQRMVRDAAQAYHIEYPPQTVEDCHAAYQVVTAEEATEQQKKQALAFVRTRLTERDGQVWAEVAANQPSYRLHGMAVSAREETAYAAAALLAGREMADLPKAIAAANYLTGQLNAEGRLYSTIDTAACLSLLIELRRAGVVTGVGGQDEGRVLLNGQEMTLHEALQHEGSVDKVMSLRCLNGVIAVQVTTEFTEDWGTFKGQIPLEVRLEKRGQAQQRFKVGDELELVVRVPRYEPGMLVHVCLPDALARIVGGGQVKRFSLDFCEWNELRVPLAAVGATVAAGEKSERGRVFQWLGLARESGAEQSQRWALIVRNMFKEEEVGNPGLLRVVVQA